MGYLEDKYEKYKEKSTDFLKKELDKERHFYQCESIETDITAAHDCYYCELRITAIKKVLNERVKL